MYSNETIDLAFWLFYLYCIELNYGVQCSVLKDTHTLLLL